MYADMYAEDIEMPAMFARNYGWACMPTWEMSRRLQSLAEQLRGLEFDTIAVRGSSGIGAGMAMAMSLNKNLVYCRKPDEWSHGGNDSTANTNAVHRYVIVDDFVVGGNTIKAIKKTLNDAWKNEREFFSRNGVNLPRPVCVALALYDDRVPDRGLIRNILGARIKILKAEGVYD